MYMPTIDENKKIPLQAVKLLEGGFFCEDNPIAFYCFFAINPSAPPKAITSRTMASISGCSPS